MKKLLLVSISALTLMTAPYSVQAAGETTASANPHVTTASTEAEYRTKLGGLGTMSLMASQIAVGKAGTKDVADFAKFEVEEQTAISTVLKELNTPMPPMAAKDTAILDKLKSTPKGPAFDAAYLQASLNTHNELRDLNENFLSHSSTGGSAAEMEARHLATVALPTIRQHIAQSQMLLAEMPK